MRIIALAVATSLLALPSYAADVPLSTKAPPPPVTGTSSTNWTGLYLGAFVGYGWGSNSPSVSSIEGLSGWKEEYVGSVVGTPGPDLRMDGALLGGQVGYDWQVTPRIVVGLAADAAWAGLHGTASLGNIQMTKDMKFLANLDARAGYLITSSTMAYVIGGLSVATLKSNVTPIGYGGYGPVSISGGSESSTKWGWNLGAGLESRISQQWSIFGDARYFKFKDSITPVAGYICEDEFVANVSTGNQYSAFRIGLNWRPEIR